MEFIQKLRNNIVYTDEPLKKIERDMWIMLLRNKDRAFTSGAGDENVTTILFIISSMR